MRSLKITNSHGDYITFEQGGTNFVFLSMGDIGSQTFGI